MSGAWKPLMTSAAGVEYFFRRNADGDYEVFSTQENDPFLEQNARLRSLDDRGYTSASKDFRREASIPMALIEKWKREDGVNVLHPDGHEYLKRKVNDYDFAYLRTSPGKT